MPFILPAGDYEAALRMAGASNFMEAFESGIDRNIRRRGQREALRQQRDLYERGLGLEKERLAEKHLSGIEGYDRDFPAVATAGANEAALADVVTAASTQAAVDGALAEEAAVASPDTSAIHAKIRENRMARRAAQGVPVVQATPAQVEQAVVAAATPIPGVTPRPVSGSVPAESGWSEDDIARLTEIGFIGSNSANNMLHAARRYRASGDAATAELLERRAAMTEGGSFSDSRANARSTDLFRVTPPGPVYGPVAPPAEKPWWYGRDEGGPRLGPELPPGYRPPGRQYTQQELALGTPRPGVAYGPARPVGVVTPDPDPVITEIWRAPNVVDVGSLPPEEFALATPRGESQREVQLREAVRLISEGRAVDAQELLGASGKAYPSLGVETAAEGPTIPPDAGPGIALNRAVQELMDQGRYIDAQNLIGEAGQVYPDARTEEALSGGAPIDERPVPSDWMVEPIAVDLPPEGDAVSDAASAAGAIGASLPGGGGSSAIQAALSAMAGGSPVEAAAKAATPSPLEAAIATGAEAKERAELVGPEVEVSTAPVEVIDEKTGKVHTVKPGEFVYGIAKSYGASPQALIKANQSLFIGKDGKARSLKTKGGKLLAGADLIFPGEKLRIPTGEGRETGGPAGPVDTREGVKEGVLAKAEKGAKSEKEVVARLEKEQAKRTDVPLNPFQAFGRDIGYTPSVGAVAYATHMAEQGDFSMINMMAGRVVKNAELPGLFARYSNFASGARRRSKEILLEEKLAKETQANAAKQKAAMGVRTMALTQFQRAGHGLEDAQLFAGHYADLWAVDPQQARAWSTSLNAMGTERARAEAETIKHGRKNYGGGRTGVVAPDGRGTAKMIASAEKRLDKLARTRGDALRPLLQARGLSEGMRLGDDDLAALAKDPAYAAALTAYNQANERYVSQKNQLDILINGRPEKPSPFDMLTSSKKIADLADKYGETGDWDGFTREISLYGEVTPEIAEQVVEFFSGKAPPAVTPSKVTSSPKARSEQDIAAEAKLVSARKPLSASAAKQQSRRTAELKAEARDSAKARENKELLAEFNKITSQAEDLLIQRNAGESLSAGAVEPVTSGLRAIISTLVEKRELEGGELWGDRIFTPGTPPQLRRGTSISKDIRNLRYLLSELGG